MTDVLIERAKTHGDFYDVAAMAQELKDALRRGKNWKVLDDTQREALQMIASKIGRILAGNPHDVDHWRDIAGYARLIEMALSAYSASERDPTRRRGACSPETPSPAQPSCVWPDEEEQPGT